MDIRIFNNQDYENNGQAEGREGLSKNPVGGD